MISFLRNVNSVVAAGILARAALALDDRGNPAAAPALPEEQNLRAEILAEVRRRLDVREDDNSAETRERLGDLLDTEREHILGGADGDEVLDRLSSKGELPSDLYNVEIIPNISNFHGRKFSREKQLIERTVKFPDLTQNYGPPKDPENPFLISLFSKTFEDKYPARSFILLVVGERQRRGQVFVVHQAWRLYPDCVDVRGATDLVDMLRRFTDAYGAEIEMGGQRGRLILLADIPDNEKIPDTIEIKGEMGRKRRHLTVSCFYQKDPATGTKKAALATCVDLIRYREMLERYGW